MWWTTHEDATIVRMTGDGATPYRIAATLNRSVAGVKSRMWRLTMSEWRPATAVNPSLVDDIRRLAAPGDLSARLIGDELGVTRNTVIGLARRHGIKLRAPRSRASTATAAAAPRQRPAPPRRVAPTVIVNLDDCRPLPPVCEPVPIEPEAVSGPVSFMNLRAGQCRWIAGQPNGLETLYCGCRVKPGSSYCPTHWRQSIAAVQPKRLRRLPSPRARDRFRSLLRVPEAAE